MDGSETFHAHAMRESGNKGPTFVITSVLDAEDGEA